MPLTNAEPSTPIDSVPAIQHARLRAFLVGVVGAALTAYVVTQAEMVLSSIRVGYLQFPPAALGLMLLIVGLNRLVKKVAARLGLSSSDLLIVYSMLLVAALISSHGMVEKLVPMLVVERYFATQTNNWHGLFDPHIPQRLMPYNVADSAKQAVVNDYFNKLPRGASVPWGAWFGPLLNWSVPIMLVMFAFLCLTAILRRQWVENEKLAFPLAQLPMEIAADEDGHSFFRDKLMWLGALVPVLVFGMKGLHQLFPPLPDITLTLLLNDYWRTPPWSTLAYTPIVLSFAAVGFFFLLPKDILFSIWFFFVVSRFQQIVAYSYNMDMPGMPVYPSPLFLGYQTIGAYLVIIAYTIWTARPHLAKVWAAAIGKDKHPDDQNEMMPYKVAFWGLFGSIGLSAIWFWINGMSLWLAFFELFGCIFLVGVVMSRMTAEGGLLMTETTFRPIDLYRMVGSVHALGPANLTMLAFFDNLFMRDQRGLVLTGMIDASSLAGRTGTNEAAHPGQRSQHRRSFALAIGIGVVVAFVVAVALNIYFPYHLGGTNMDSFMEQGSPQLTIGDYAQHFPLDTPSATAAWQMPVFLTVGIVVTLFLSIMRACFFWWPLHPLGYALMGSWSGVQFWFSCLLAWIIKSFLLRYGGMGFYSKARPFFFGLVVGEFGMAVFFVLLSIVLDHVGVKYTPPAFPWS